MTTESELFDPKFLERLRAMFFRLRKRRQLRKQGAQNTPAAGFTREFKDHRNYAPGDDYRSIDWQLVARLDRLYIRVFEEIQEFHVHVLVDCSRSMLEPFPEKRITALRAAVALAYLGLTSQHRVSVIGFGEQVRQLMPPIKGEGHIHTLLKVMADQPFTGQTDLTECLRQFRPRRDRKGVVFLISDLLGRDPNESVESMRMALKWPAETHVLQIVHPEEADPPLKGEYSLVDVETDEMRRMWLTQRDMDLARSVQAVTEEVMLRMARHVRSETGERYLCLAGGVALNCVANGQILREGLFDDVWIQPAAGDAGGALGAALFVWHQVLGRERTTTPGRDRQAGSYLGPAFAPDAIEAWLQEEAIPHHRFNEEAAVANTVADLLADEQVVGWFNGRMEFGPRALGNRSILGDARSRQMQSVINLKIKYRESFRPFAPSCLREDVSAYFELDRPSPYMLLVAPVKASRRIDMTEDQHKLFGMDKLRVPRSDIPAVTHVDYSARIQTVD
ncbi:MAG: carbamoyltransferase C-terminal domain-containing protein, partial [Phycisphaeraceae bacterium]|nr:carbamoyltransferase C-terminal domain-containing protein [Phycisphaeraceae bacterium]